MPVEGEILLGGKALEKYSNRQWRRQCGVVMQEGYIFSDTIAGNIGISDEEPDMKRVGEAVEIANIGEFIESLPLRYNTRIGSDGHGLSTGQKQRLLIARAAYKNAPYLIFDEATNALDANNEKVIMENLKRLFEGKTVIIVAHRLRNAWTKEFVRKYHHSQKSEEPSLESSENSPLPTFKSYYGPIGTGEAVIKYRDSEERKWLQKVNDKVLAVETEAGGIAQQFYEDELNYSRRAKGILVIRGISDKADVYKKEEWRLAASKNAMKVLVEILKANSF